jgi:hypothetical protein
MLKRGAFEEEANREVSAQGDREVSRRYTVRPFLDLSHNASPPSQGQQLRTQIVLILCIGNTELTERISD